MSSRRPTHPPFTAPPHGMRPPHPATVAQPKTAFGASAPERPPHPATVAQPRAALGSSPARPPHAATVVQRAVPLGPDMKTPAPAALGGAAPAALGGAAPAAAPARTVSVAFWNIARASDKKERAANALKDIADDVVICEAIQSTVLDDFTVTKPVVGTTHKKKLAYMSFFGDWIEDDLSASEAVFEGLREKLKLPLKYEDASQRRPGIKTCRLNGNTWGMAVLHATSGQNWPTLYWIAKTIVHLQFQWPNRWVLFGDLNYEPDTKDGKSGAWTALHYWLLFHLNELFGAGNHVKALYENGVHTHEYGSMVKKYNILDYAIIPVARAADVTERVIVQIPGTMIDPFTISDHRPILITIK